MPQVKKLKDRGTFSDYRPTPDDVPAGYRERIVHLAFARDEQGRDFYDIVYGWLGHKYVPATGLSYAYIEQSSGRVAQIIHDDVETFPSARTMLSHPVQNGVSFRLLTFAANRAILPGMVWNGKDGFAV